MRVPLPDVANVGGESAPKPLDSTPVLGFPTYDSARMLTLGFTVKF